MGVSLSFAEHDYDSCIATLRSELRDFANARIEISFPAEYRYSKPIRDLVSYVLEQTAVNPPWNRRFALITDELVNNSIEHGSHEGDTNAFVCETRAEDDGLLIMLAVTDSGRGPHPTTADAMRKARTDKVNKGFADHAGTRGRGLFQIIENLADSMEFEDNPGGGLTVRIIKKFAL
jgi:anti-sigma regulatory factor (Ser/Thr protein kinase)